MQTQKLNSIPLWSAKATVQRTMLSIFCLDSNFNSNSWSWSWDGGPGGGSGSGSGPGCGTAPKAPSYVAPCLAYDFKNCPFWGFDLQAKSMTSYLGAKSKPTRHQTDSVQTPALNRDTASQMLQIFVLTVLEGKRNKNEPNENERWCRSSHINCTIRKQQ